MNEKGIMDDHEDALKEGYTLLDGHLIKVGTPDQSEIYRRRVEHARRGREILEKAGFLRWLVRTDGCSDTNARRNAAFVYNAMCLCQQPDGSFNWLAAVENPVYSVSTRRSMRAAIKKWAQFTSNIELWAQMQTADVGDGVERKPPDVSKDPKTQAKPLADHEYEALIKAVDKVKGDPRMPWFWPVIRLALKTGIRPTDLVVLTKKGMHEALARKGLNVWSSNRKPYVIPLWLVKPEVEALAAWPLNWGTIADLMSPKERPKSRKASARAKVGKAVARVYEQAGIDKPHGWIHQLRVTCGMRVWKRTGNLIVTAQVLGHKDLMRTRAYLGITEMGARFGAD